ncbi:hypothetical protein [Curtobacterium flaccumfaciens]|uniref:hypothetical protein n=1 Tax=Curtobacterium flaccumfaciens TaxID=2035 RepID=UPI00387A7B19
MATKTYYSPCGYWLPTGGGTSERSFPVKSSGSYNCFFTDGSSYGGGAGGTFYQCAPHGDRASNGRVVVFKVDSTTHKEIYAYYFCLYPTDAYAPIERMTGSGKIYTGGQGNFYRTVTSGEATVYASTGTRTASSGYISRGVDLSHPEAYTGAWQPGFRATTGTKSDGTPLYGYYRLTFALDYRLCQKWEYPSWLGQPVRYDCAKQGQDRIVNPYTYACNLNPALQGGIKAGAKFYPSQCVTGWRCVIGPNIKVGGQPLAVSVMRNGQQVRVDNPTVAVAGNGIRDARNWRTKEQIAGGSTPLLGSDPNSSRQYFKAGWRFNDWHPYAKTSNIAFYWASTDQQHPFQWKQSYSFTSDYLVPTQSAVGEATHYKWVTDSAVCPDVRASAKTLVVRSANH